jgi:glycosyltransferase involved in cell wall biosynthesis
MENASTPNNVELLVVDNDSIEPYTDTAYQRVLRNNVNPGVYASLAQGTEQTSNNLVLWMHNDVLLHEKNWDTRIEREFEKDTKLGLAGFFGGRGVGMDGGRIHPEGNLLGKEWGQNISVHGHKLTGTHPAVVFDSLAMVFRKDIFYSIQVPYVAPHHWFDRIMTLWFVSKGYHALTIGIAFDHAGGGTSVANSRRHSEFVERWCRSKGLPLDQNWDHTLYQYGYKFFRNQWKGKFPVMVDRNFNVQWGNTYDDLSDL